MATAANPTASGFSALQANNQQRHRLHDMCHTEGTQYGNEITG